MMMMSFMWATVHFRGCLKKNMINYCKIEREFIKRVECLMKLIASCNVCAKGIKERVWKGAH